MTLIAKPIVKNQFWVITDGEQKVGNVLADNTGFEVKLNGGTAHFKNTKAIEKAVNIQFKSLTKPNKVDTPFDDYPTTAKVYNSMLDVKRKIHLYTKTLKSKCYYAAGWFNIQQGQETETVFCPKYIFVQRYPYDGPYKTKDEALKVINN